MKTDQTETPKRKTKNPTKIIETEPLLLPYSNINGLNSLEIKQRIATGQVNGDQNIKTKSVGQIIRSHTFTFFNFLFLCFGIILAFFIDKGENNKLDLGDFANFGFVFVVVGNIIIGIFQELRAKKTIDKLSLLSAPRTTVIRNGKEQDIPLKNIVMDDIVILSQGRQVVADSIVVEGEIEVDESQITGEPDAIQKRIGDEILSGSFVVSGKAKSKVIRVGKDNYTYKISSGAKYIKAPNSEIMRTLNRFIKLMAIIIIPLGIALFSIKYFMQHDNLKHTVDSVIGALIGMIPSGLIMLTSTVFCVSVIRLSKHNTLVQDQYAVETLARTDVLCLDKTGTITEGEMEVKELIPSSGYSVNKIKDILANVINAIGDNNSTANAIQNYTKDIATTKQTYGITPFSSERKWSGANFADGSYILGATEFIYHNISNDLRSKIAGYSAKGYRVISLSHSAHEIQNNTLPSGLEIICFILIIDKIRLEAPDTLAYFDKQGVKIKIISGDNPVTVKSVAERAGVKNADKYIDASTLKTKKEIARAVEEYTVFGRVTPDQKLAFIKALKAKGHTVGMTGDGVNDVLALKEADCSIAMASGSDPAKNVSSLVLLDSNFANIPKVVAEGRRSINNLERSATLYLVKTVYNLLFSIIFMIIASALPFEPKHLTLIGMVTIGIPSFVLALAPNKEIVKGHFFEKVLHNSLPASITIVLSVVALTFLARIFPDEISPEQISTMCMIVTVLIGFCYIAKISMPFNTTRVIMMLCIVAMFIGAFFADFSFFSLTDFFGLSVEFNRQMLTILLPTAFISVGILFLFFYLSQQLTKNKLIKKFLKLLKLI